MTEEAWAMFGMTIAGICTVFALLFLLACGVGAFISVGMSDDKGDENG